MVLRKITIDNSVKYVPITEINIKQNATKIKNSTYFWRRQTKQKIFKK